MTKPKKIVLNTATLFMRFIIVFASLYQKNEKKSYTLSSIKQEVYTFFFYFLLFLYSSHSLRHPSATAHSPSSKELNPSSQEDVHLSGHYTSAN